MSKLLLSFVLSFSVFLSGCHNKPKPKSDNTEKEISSSNTNVGFDPSEYDQSNEINHVNGDYLLLDKIYFGFDRQCLSKQSLHVLSLYASELLKADINDKKLIISGHADERGTAEYNIALGNRRADSVRKEFQKLGINLPIDTKSYGKFKPAIDEHNAAAWKQNRRAEFNLVLTENSTKEE
ncbi:MAG: OmpA family protein [Alphaproteobacteria bacterium]|nr:OmpA family protein [Rickettsiales bacterium]